MPPSLIRRQSRLNYAGRGSREQATRLEAPVRASAQANPGLFARHNSLLVINEVQRARDLFLAIKHAPIAQRSSAVASASACPPHRPGQIVYVMNRSGTTRLHQPTSEAKHLAAGPSGGKTRQISGAIA
jgi:hypothetical protein